MPSQPQHHRFYAIIDKSSIQLSAKQSHFLWHFLSEKNLAIIAKSMEIDTQHAQSIQHHLIQQFNVTGAIQLHKELVKQHCQIGCRYH